MSLVVMGASYKTAPLSVREQLAVAEEKQAEVLQRLVSHESVREAFLLSTCNRVEFYVDAKTDRLGAQACAEAIAERLGGPIDAGSSYVYRGVETARHLFRVVSSLDSQVLGEAQIMGQVKEAYATAVGAGTCGEVMTRLFKIALQLGKQVRSVTRIGADSVSMSTTAFKAAAERVDDLTMCKAVVIGAGEMARLIVNYLEDGKVGDLVLCARPSEHAREFAEAHGMRFEEFDERYEQIAHADLVFSMTSAQGPIITRDELAKSLQARGDRRAPVIIVDEAVPRDVEEECAELDDVVLIDSEQLAAIVDEGLATRMQAVAEVERLIDSAEDQFLTWMQERLVTPTVREIYQKGEITVSDELERARKALKRALGDEPSEEALQVLEAYGSAVMKKLLHGPIMRLRREATTPDSYYYTGAARYLFGLDVFPPGTRIPCETRECDRGEACPIGLQDEMMAVCRAMGGVR